MTGRGRVDPSLRRPGSETARQAPLGDPEFAAAMAAVGPFEPCPELAVAVSGGPDSLALALLADRWARARSGAIVAVTVDHRLRPESSAEAAQVGEWLRARGIRHEILVWDGPYPIHDLQAAARAARYRLLGEWCRRAQLLHLLTAHHQDDQAETLILRLGRGSGLAGLAGMAPIVEDGHHRLLRPLLPVPAARLKATLAALEQAWLEDPSNRNPAFARVRVRAQKSLFAEAGLTPQSTGIDPESRLARQLDALRIAAISTLWGVAAVSDETTLATGESETKSAKYPRLRALLNEQWAEARGNCKTADKFMMFFDATLALDKAAEPKVGRDPFMTLGMQTTGAMKKGGVGTIGVGFEAITDTGKFRRANVAPPPPEPPPAEPQAESPKSSMVMYVIAVVVVVAAVIGYRFLSR